MMKIRDQNQMDMVFLYGYNLRNYYMRLLTERLEVLFQLRGVFGILNT